MLGGVLLLGEACANVDILSVLSTRSAADTVQNVQPNTTHRAETWHDLTDVL